MQHRLRYDRESFRPVDQTGPLTNHQPTLEEAYLEYVCEKQFTKRDLACHLGKMRIPLRKFGTTPLAMLTSADLEELKAAYLADKKITTATAHGRLSVLRTLFRWAEQKGYCEHVKFPTLPQPNFKQFIPPSSEEIAAIYAAAAPHIRRVIVIGSQMGARVGACELLQLQWSDVDFSHKVLRIHGSKKNHHAQWREVPIRESLIPQFREWQQEDEREGMAYLIHFCHKPLKFIWNGFQAAVKRAGITRRIRPYDLRHAFGTELVAAGVDVGTVAKLMGHANPTMLLTHYQYVMDKQKRAAVEALPEAPSMCRAHVPQKNHSQNANSCRQLQ